MCYSTFSLALRGILQCLAFLSVTLTCAYTALHTHTNTPAGAPLQIFLADLLILLLKLMAFS